MLKFADMFAGGGGTTTGALNVPDLFVAWALNHDPIAIQTHAAAHPETKHYQADIRTQDVSVLEPVDILWASLECTEHSKAKGGKEKNVGSFTLGWELYRYLPVINPDVLMIENVSEFIRWGKLRNGQRVKESEGTEYIKWVNTIREMGWSNYEYRFLNAADFGAPTRRIRYFGIFTKPGIEISWPQQTHHQNFPNISGLKKWVSCRNYIDLKNEGNSIFGRSENPNVRKGKRHPLSDNTLRRIAGGIKKFAPEVHFIMKYYGTGHNCQSINEPLHTIRTHESHALISIEKKQFVQDYCHQDYHDSVEDPLRTQLTRQTKQLITFKAHFISKYYNGNWQKRNNQHHCESIETPFPTITTVNRNVLISATADITSEEKYQFITSYFNSSGKPESQNQSIENPLNTILTGTNKKALITAIKYGLIDFDIKMRFLSEDELAAIMGFPEGYFNRQGLKLNKKQKIKMIGNAVHVTMAEKLICEVAATIKEMKKIA